MRGLASNREDSDRPVYNVAARLIIVDKVYPELACFVAHGVRPDAPERLSFPAAAPANQVEPLAGEAWIGQRWRRVTCRRDPAGYTISVAGIAHLAVSASGSEIGCVELEPASSATERSEALLGPALTLALALRGAWCLHASAVAGPNGLIAFSGESGAGKSTLARALAAAPSLPFRPAADDILPVEPSATGIDALPHFPQLKLPPDRQPGVTLSERLPLRALFVLGPPSTGAALTCRHLTPRQAALAFVQHTVAARLFDPPLLAEHLAFCAAAAACTPVWSLAYPHDYALLPQVIAAVAAHSPL